MSVREALEQHKRWIGVASVVVIVACLIAARQTLRGEALSDAVTRVYFSDDDGKTYFADGIEKGVEFLHDGKQAYRAYVYRCESGKPFVAYLGRHSSSPSATRTPPDPRFPGKQEAGSGETEIKKPGDEKWVPLTGTNALAILRSLCPAGTPEAVLP